jgi:LmbE family N-acetylglucosaminyl deacetylase
MSTIVFVHAHPDDEASSTGGSMARAAAEGHRVVLVICTDGDLGEAPDDLADGETVVDRRRKETAASTAILGVDRTVWLGYQDSGMTGWPQNEDPASFWQADVEEAGGRLAAVLREEQADVIVIYDWHGGYGHPDHVQVHRVGHRAADLAGTPRRFESTFNRDAMKRRLAEAPPLPVEERSAEDGPSAEFDFDPDGPADDGNPFGTPESGIDLRVDVSAFLDQKRRALASHASQTTDVGMMIAMPPDVFALFFGTEWFIVPGDEHHLHDGWLLDPA